MSKKNKPLDKDVQKILDILVSKYQRSHPKSVPEVKRQNSVSIRIRIVDPDFKGKDRVERDDEVWEILQELSADIQSQITLVLLLTPEEIKTSFANMEFEHPVPSRL